MLIHRESTSTQYTHADLQVYMCTYLVYTLVHVQLTHTYTRTLAHTHMDTCTNYIVSPNGTTCTCTCLLEKIDRMWLVYLIAWLSVQFG